MWTLWLFSICIISLVIPGDSLNVDLRLNDARLITVREEEEVVVSVKGNVNGFNSIILYANAMNGTFCMSLEDGRCGRKKSGSKTFSGKDIGLERVSNEFESGMKWFMRSTVFQDIFIVFRGYKKAPIIGACSAGRDFESYLFNPNLRIDDSHDAYNVLSFNYSSILATKPNNYIIKCSDRSLWPLISYEVYAIPWNQRYDVPQPNFKISSLKSLTNVLNESSTFEVMSNGIFLTSFKMTSFSPPTVRISKRLGLDVVIAVAAHLETSDEESSHYVSKVMPGCFRNGDDCAYLVPLWTKVLTGCIAVFGFLFAHLGRRFHKFNVFFSAYFLGFLICYPLFKQFSYLSTDVILVSCFIGCSVVLGGLTMAIFWRSKPNNKLSYLPLYICASFLIISSLFFTSIGNIDFWHDTSAFFGVFFGLVAFLAIFVCPCITEVIAVDLCTALIGTFIFISSILALLAPGCVFPYLLLDAINRVSIPGNYAALSIFVSSTIDFGAFAAWPVLTILVTVINHYCSPSLNREHSNRTVPQPVPANDTAEAPVEPWPPLPPAAFVSERQPLLNNERRNSAIHPTAPPAYYPPDEAPPAYRP